MVISFKLDFIQSILWIIWKLSSGQAEVVLGWGRLPPVTGPLDGMAARSSHQGDAWVCAVAVNLTGHAKCRGGIPGGRKKLRRGLGKGELEVPSHDSLVAEMSLRHQTIFRRSDIKPYSAPSPLSVYYHAHKTCGRSMNVSDYPALICSHSQTGNGCLISTIPFI